MTRWIVLHSTQGVTLARNVGYKSIGHGYYLEDGTETDNKFHSNIGIFARAAIATVDAGDNFKVVANPQNPRMVPGILSDNQDPKEPKFATPNVANPGFPYRSDVEYPTVFWITNGWNDFIGNMAAGAGTCGAAYWLVPASNMNMVEVPSAANKGADGVVRIRRPAGPAGFRRRHAPEVLLQELCDVDDELVPDDGQYGGL